MNTGMRRYTDHDSVCFRIPSLPASNNSIYQILFHQKRVIMKPEVRTWKTQAKQFMPPMIGDDTYLFRIEANFTYNWMYKNGNMKRFDTQNLMKVLIDAVAERYGFKDELVKWGNYASTHDDEVERVDVKLVRIKEDVVE